MCHCVSIFHLGRNYQAVKFKRIMVSVGEELHRVIFEIVRMQRPVSGKRWQVVTWDIDGRQVRFHPQTTRKAAAQFIRQACP